MIKAVIFDIDNTLYDFDSVHIKAMNKVKVYVEKTFGISSDEFENRLSKAQSKMVDRLGKDSAATHSRIIRFQEALEELSDKNMQSALTMCNLYWDTLLDIMEPEKGIEDFIKALINKGIKIGVGSNMTSHMQFEKLEKLGLLKHIDRVITSESAGAEKPSDKFFKLCVEKMGCKPEECLFIGDNIKYDVEGAISGGLNGMWYNKKGDVPQEYGKYPRIFSYEECVRKGELVAGDFVIAL